MLETNEIQALYTRWPERFAGWRFQSLTRAGHDKKRCWILGSDPVGRIYFIKILPAESGLFDSAEGYAAREILCGNTLSSILDFIPRVRDAQVPTEDSFGF